MTIFSYPRGLMSITSQVDQEDFIGLCGELYAETRKTQPIQDEAPSRLRVPDRITIPSAQVRVLPLTLDLTRCLILNLIFSFS